MRVLSFVVLAVVLNSAFAFAQLSSNPQRTRIDGYAIHGKLVLADARTVDQRVEVRLERAQGQVIQTTYVDAAGNFDFRNLTMGSYAISISADGYEPVNQTVEASPYVNSSVTIFLNKPAFEIHKKPEGLDADRDVVDIHQIEQNFPKKALRDYEKAVEEKRKGRLDSAVKLLQEAIELAPDFSHAHNALGLIYQSMTRYAEAEQEFQFSRRVSAKDERPLVYLGSLYIEEAGARKGDREAAGKILDQALDALEEAVKVNPRSATAFFLLGQANYRSAFWEESETAFSRALDLDPHLTVAQLMLANVEVRLRKWEDVLRLLDGYLESNPNAADRQQIEAMRGRAAKNVDSAGSSRLVNEQR